MLVLKTTKTAHHQEVLLCIYSSWYMSCVYDDRLLVGSECQQPVNINAWHIQTAVDCVWNVMAHAQKPDCVFRGNGRIHLYRQGRHFSRLLSAEVCASAFIVGSNAGYTMLRGGVKGTGYSLHSPVSPSLPLPCVTVCHHVSTGLYIHSNTSWWWAVSLFETHRD